MKNTRLGIPVASPVLALGVALGWALLPTDLAAQIELVHGERFSLDLTGYVRTLTAIHDPAFPTGSGSGLAGIHGAVTRLKWTASFGDAAVLEVHDRILATLTTEGTSAVAGFGVSATPGRALDLSSTWVDEERLGVVHDVDRLAVTVPVGAADVTLGRQAVSWGTSSLFPVAEVWAAFSPFELDTEERPGVDAVRVLAYPARGIELDAVAADRGGSDALSAGVRATWSLAQAEVWAGAGKFWNEAMVLGGLTLLGDQTKLRAEAALPRDLDRDETLDPRVTLGVDRIGARLLLSGELHFNGPGARDPATYVTQLLSSTLARGESYYLGRWYAGGVASWTVDAESRLNVTGSVLLNLDDGSAAVSPTATYDLGQSARVSVGGVMGLGDPPLAQAASPLPRLRSEFGTYGDLGYLRVSLYF